MRSIGLGIVCGISVLFVAAVLPAAQDGAPTPAAQAPAAQAPAATPAPEVLPPSGTIAGGAPLATLELTGSGKLIHVHGPQDPGQAPFKSSIKADMVGPCVDGTDASCSGLLTPADGGKVYLFIDALDSWRLANNLAGDNAVLLTGVVDGKGTFTMTGTDAVSETSFVVTGKLSFIKGTFSPTKVSGKITAVSATQGHAGTGKFKGAQAEMPV